MDGLCFLSRLNHFIGFQLCPLCAPGIRTLSCRTVFAFKCCLLHRSFKSHNSTPKQTPQAPATLATLNKMTRLLTCFLPYAPSYTFAILSHDRPTVFIPVIFNRRWHLYAYSSLYNAVCSFK